MKRKILVFTLIKLLSVNAAYATMAQTGAKSLLFAGSARESAMGDTGVALKDTINAVGFNPAGIAGLNKHELSFQHTSWLLGTEYNYLAALYPLKKSAVAVTFTYLDYGSFKRRSSTGADRGAFKADDLVMDISYAASVTDRLDAGVRLRYLRQRIAEFSSSSIPADLGISYKLVPDKVQMGLSLQNLGAKSTKLNTRQEELPSRVRVGASFTPFEESVIFNVEHCTVDGEYTFLNTGIELDTGRHILLRAGLSSSNEFEDGSVFKTGLGFNIGSYYLDYAYEPFGELDNCHKFSVRMQF